jgi:peptide/nickel transport system substrate-binding protein
MERRLSAPRLVQTRRGFIRLTGGAMLAAGGLPILEACGSSSSSSGKATGLQTVIIANNQPIPGLDPDQTAADVPFSAIMEICEPLLDYDTTTRQIIPRLATSYSFVDAKTLEVKLRSGVKFSNGEPLTAAAVEFTINRTLSPATKSLQSFLLTGVQGVEVIDDLTARFHLSAPNVLLPQYLTIYPILPPKYTAANNEKLATALVGTGPYKLASFQSGYQVSLTRNPTYWGTQAGYPKAGYRYIESSETQVSALLSGQIQIAANILPQQAKSLTGNSAIRIESKPVLLLAYVTLDAAGRTAKHGPMTNKLVRQALNMGANIEGIIKDVLLGYGSPIGTIAHPAQFGFDSSIKPYAYDPRGAKQLLAQAGYADGLNLRMISQTADITGQPEAAQAIQQNLAQIGVNLTLQTMTDPSAVGATVMGGTAGPMVQFGNAAGGVFDVAATWESFLTGNPFSYFANPTFMQMYNQQLGTIDPDQRKPILASMQQLLHEEAPALFQWAVDGIWGVSSGVDWPGYPGRADRLYTAKPA